jgi:hypothetical protein
LQGDKKKKKEKGKLVGIFGVVAMPSFVVVYQRFRET